MRYLSVCSGIEAATVAWHPLGWQPIAFSEIESFPGAVLSHHYPTVPNLGDMTKFEGWSIGTIDVLVGGTPCQSFSVAGLRKGLSDPRGNLALVYCGILDRFKPQWFVWENVPGVLSSNGGRDFGSFLGAVAELGYGWAYRVLDAQYFGVAQRRRRVFVVGHLGNWRPAAKVLLEPESLSGNPAPRRKSTETVANCLGASPSSSGSPNIGNGRRLEDQHALGGAGLFVPHVMSSDQANASITENISGAFDCLHEAPIAFHPTQTPISNQELCHSLGANGNATAAVATLDARTQGGGFPGTDGAIGGHIQPIGMQVRRLTPVECERLQGFPDNYTDIKPKGKPTPDGPRYKALGNSMAVPVMAWIGERISNQ